MSKKAVDYVDAKTGEKIDIQEALTGQLEVKIVQEEKALGIDWEKFVKESASGDFPGLQVGNLLLPGTYLQFQQLDGKYKGIEFLSLTEYRDRRLKLLHESTGVHQHYCDFDDKQRAKFMVVDGDHGLGGKKVCKDCADELEMFGFEVVSVNKLAMVELAKEFAKILGPKLGNFDSRPGAVAEAGTKEARGVNLEAKCALNPKDPMISEWDLQEEPPKWWLEVVAGTLDVAVDDLPSFKGMYLGQTWFAKFRPFFEDYLYGGFSFEDALGCLEGRYKVRRFGMYKMSDGTRKTVDATNGRRFAEGASRVELVGAAWTKRFEGFFTSGWFLNKFLAPRGSYAGFPDLWKWADAKTVAQITRLQRTVTGQRGAKKAARYMGGKSKTSQKSTKTKGSGSGSRTKRKGGRGAL